MSKPFTLFVAMVYGMCWIVAPLNLLAAFMAAREGGNPLSYSSTLLLAFGVILIVHNRMGWFPFPGRK